MIIQSLLTKPSVFQLGKRSAVVAANGTWALPDADERSFRDARKYEDLGYLTIVEGPKIKQDISSRTLPAYAAAVINVAAAPGETFTVRNLVSGKEDVFAFVVDGAETPMGTTRVATDAADAPATLTAFAEAINGKETCPVKATVVDDTVYLHHRALGKSGSTIGLKSSLPATITVGGDEVDGFTKLLDGVYGASVGVVMQTVVAAGDTVTLVTGLPEISHIVVQVRTAAGAVKAYDGVVTSVGGVITADSTGVADIAATDSVTFLIFG